ncbi:MAG: hypothetical protein EA397_16875, partial [Deltaproteobacteria bacterium]
MERLAEPFWQKGPVSGGPSPTPVERRFGPTPSLERLDVRDSDLSEEGLAERCESLKGGARGDLQHTPNRDHHTPAQAARELPCDLLGQRGIGLGDAPSQVQVARHPPGAFMPRLPPLPLAVLSLALLSTACPSRTDSNTPRTAELQGLTTMKQPTKPWSDLNLSVGSGVVL